MACPVCFGGDDTLMREGLTSGIGVLMGVTAIVLACFARFIVRLAQLESREEKWGRGSFKEDTPAPMVSTGVSSLNDPRPHFE